jgi:hypothetical protein
MKTTIDIPDTLYRKAKIRAAERGMTLRTLVVKSLEDELSLAKYAATKTQDLPPVRHSELDESGWPVLKRRLGDTTVITNEFINKLREEEGI